MKKSLLFVVHILVFSFLNKESIAQAELNFASQLQCNDYSYCVDITINASTGNNFDVGTSSFLINYNTTALSFKNYIAQDFDSTSTCSNTWSPQQYDLDEVGGQFSLTMKLLNQSSTCINVDDQTPKVIGTLCFDILQQGASPELIFDTNQTHLNSNNPDNGTNAITIDSFKTIQAQGVLACDCLGQGLSCDDQNPYTTNDQFDINCDCNGELLDVDNDGIADGVDPCQDINYEAEDAFFSGPKIRSNYGQYYGNGYIDYTNTPNDSLLFELTIIDSGSHDLTFRYSNGSNYDKYLTMYIDGVLVNNSLAFPKDTSWAIWNEIVFSHTFTVGKHTLLLQDNNNWGPNIDRLTTSFCTGCTNTGQFCDDGDSCTILDIYDLNCNCVGMFLDEDDDGVCDNNDICDGFDDAIDTDGDGTPDGCDNCDNTLIGLTCDDGDSCTINDMYDANCNCVGTFNGTDSDNDGICDAFDICVGGDDNLDIDEDGIPDFCDTCNDNTIGMPCDDGNPCTVLDVVTPGCGCGGIPIYVEISEHITDVTCNGFDDGQIDLTISGAFGDQLFNWSSGHSESDIDSLAPGNYSVTVTDFRGCQDSADFIVNEPLTLTTAISTVTTMDTTGSIDLTPNGGIAPYQFVWETGDSTEDITNLIAGTYSVTVSDANNCTNFLDVDVYPSNICIDTVYQAEDGVIQNMSINTWNPNGALGTAYIYFSNDSLGQASYQLDIPADGFYTIGFRYADKWGRNETILIDGNIEFQNFYFPSTGNWSNWDKIEFVQYFTAGTHTLGLKFNQAWGPRLDFISVCNQVVVPITLADIPTDNVCHGDSIGSLEIVATGGTRNYSYLWSTGDTTATIDSLLAGTYYVTVTDEVGQTTIDTAIIGEPTAITPVFTMRTASCYGSTNGRATVAVTGGTPGYMYSWSNGPTWKSTYNVPAGFYTLTVTDNAGCVNVTTVEVLQPDTLNAYFATTPSTSLNDGTIDMTVIGGTFPYSYHWKDNDSTEDRTNMAVGYHKVTITDDNNCKIYTGANVFPDSMCLDMVYQAEDGVLNNVGYHIWNPAGATGRGYMYFTDDTTGTATYTLNIPHDGYYDIGFRYSDKWTDREVTIALNNTILYQDFTFPRTYDWNDYEQIGFTQYFTTGTHTFELRHNENWGPRIDYFALCDLSIDLMTTNTNNTCDGDALATASVVADGGRPPYSYNWSTGDTTATINNLAKGIYYVSVSDTLGQVAIDTIIITAPDPINTNFTTTDVDCNGSATGTTAVIVTGGNSNYSYLWNNGDTTNSINNLTAGAYSVSITDGLGCIRMDSTIVLEPTLLSLNTPSITNANCNNTASGSINIAASGGTMPHQYLWDNGDTTANIQNLTAGIYQLTVTDGNGCQTTTSATITEPTVLVINTPTTIDVDCNGNASGSASITASGGTSGYQYLWSNGDTTAMTNNLVAGNYTISVTDALGCTTNSTITINQPPALVTSSIVTDVDCNGNASGSASITVSGGTSGYTYLWDNGDTTANIQNLTVGIYNATITDALGCNINTNVVINQPAVLVSDPMVTNIDCNGNANGQVDITTMGGTSPYSYQWSNGNTTNTITNLNSGNYNVTITDNLGCTTDTSVTITEPTILQLSYTVTSSTGSNGSIDVTTTGGTPNYNFLWNDGETTEDRNNLSPGNYNLTVTDANNCSIFSSSITVVADTMTSTINIPTLSMTPTLNPYPNPVKDDLTVEIKLFKAKEASLSIVDISGKVLYAIELENNRKIIKKQIDVRFLADGVYLVVLKTEHGSIVKKLVK